MSSSLPAFNSQEAIVGWRGWSIIHPHFLMSANTVWLPQERYEAFCNARYHPDDERVPVEDCSCGVYAFTAPYEVKQQGYTNQVILGEVSLWGKVIEHTKGYKAEYAYPRKLVAKSEELYWEENKHNTINRLGHLPRNLQYERYRQLTDYIAFRYGVPLEVADSSHPIYVITPEEQRRQAELERWRRLAIAQQRAINRKKNEAMRLAATKLPPTRQGMGFKSLWEQICYEADQAVADKLKGKKL